MEVSFDVAILIRWAREVVGKAASRGEIDSCATQVILHDSLGIINTSVRLKLASAD